MEERNYEQEAREQGWKPKEEFNGPEDKWTDAKTFVEKGEKITGILKSRVDRLEQTAAELRKANKEFGEYQKRLRETEREKLKSRISELEAQRAAAINEGDGQAFTRLDREIDSAKQGLHEPAPANGAHGIDPIGEAWARDNQWYGRDMKLTAFADGISAMVEAEGYSGQAYFNEITRRTKDVFPESFENPRKGGANPVDEGGEIETGGSKAHTYENLPPDARAACDRFVEAGLTSKEDYVASYEWEE